MRLYNISSQTYGSGKTMFSLHCSGKVSSFKGSSSVQTSIKTTGRRMTLITTAMKPWVPVFMLMFLGPWNRPKHCYRWSKPTQADCTSWNEHFQAHLMWLSHNCIWSILMPGAHLWLFATILRLSLCSFCGLIIHPAGRPVPSGWARAMEGLLDLWRCLGGRFVSIDIHMYVSIGGCPVEYCTVDI